MRCSWALAAVGVSLPDFNLWSITVVFGGLPAGNIILILLLTRVGWGHCGLFKTTVHEVVCIRIGRIAFQGAWDSIIIFVGVPPVRRAVSVSVLNGEGVGPYLYLESIVKAIAI